MRPNAGCYSSPAGLGGHGRGVMQRGIVGRLSPATFAVSQSNSTFFHSAGESNDARRHLNFVDKNVVFSPANLVPRNETYSPVKLASSNELFLPPNLAPSNEMRRERNFAPVNAVSDSNLVSSNQTLSALNPAPSNRAFWVRSVGGGCQDVVHDWGAGATSDR
jgi:hypothetical protein